MQKEFQNGQKAVYRQLMWMALVSFMFMYAALYVLFEEVIRGVKEANPFFMASIFTMPIVIVQLVLVGGLKRTRFINALIIGLCGCGFIFFYFQLAN